MSSHAASPKVLDLEALLAPVPGDRPAGRNLKSPPSSAWLELRELRKLQENRELGLGDGEKPEWRSVAAGARALLSRESKDLEVANWLVQAALRLYGFAGLRDGLELYLELHDRYWDGLWPEVEDDDVELRAAQVQWLAHRSNVAALLNTALTDPSTGGYSWNQWSEARRLATVSDGAVLEEALADGKIRLKTFEDAARATPPAFYIRLGADIDLCLARIDLLDQLAEVRYPDAEISLHGLKKALESCLEVVNPRRPSLEAPAAAPGPGAGASTPPPVNGPAAAPARPPASGPASAPVTRVAAVSGALEAAPDASRLGADWVPKSLEDVPAIVAGLASFVRQQAPGHPWGYLLPRALRWGEARLPEQTGVDPLAPPPTETRLALRRLEQAGAWAQLLELAEQAAVGPEGRSWLDPHRFSWLALTRLGGGWLPVADVLLEAVRARVSRDPGLLEAELADGTLAASAATRRWLEEAFEGKLPTAAELKAAAEKGEEVEPLPGEHHSLVWELARAALDDHRLADGLRMLHEAAARATHRRDRFLLQLECAELAIEGEEPEIAYPILERLAEEVEKRSLGEWEAGAIDARVQAGLVVCLRAQDEERAAAKAFEALCRLDINRALALRKRT